MKKAQFKALLILELVKQNLSVEDIKRIESAIAKTGRAMVAMHGAIVWGEYEIANAVCFYHEYQSVRPTFNQTNYRNNRY